MNVNARHSENLLKTLANQPVKFKDAVTEIIFMARPVDVFQGEYDVNRILHYEEVVTVSDYLTELGIDINDMPFEIKEMSGSCGWGYGCVLEQGEDWIEFEHIFDESHGYFVIKPKIWPCDGFCDCYCQ